MTILLTKLVFPRLHFLFSLGSTLNFSKHGCNGGEEEGEPYFALRIIHVLKHACEVCCGHSSIAFARRVGEVKLGMSEIVKHAVRRLKFQN